MEDGTTPNKPPTPMTPEIRKLVRSQTHQSFSVGGGRNPCFDADKFMYGNAWFGTAAYYKSTYRGSPTTSARRWRRFRQA